MKPSIGRIVHFLSSADAVPMAAIVTAVSGDHVNLCVFTGRGGTLPVTGVPFVFEGMERLHSEDHRAMWPPLPAPVLELQRSAQAPGDVSTAGGGQRGAVVSASASVRVTQADIEAAIRSEFYFTAHDGVQGESQLGTSPASWTGLNMVTFCVIVMRNGTKVVGINYGAIDPAQHDAQRGREEARKNATDQMWPLLGYALRSALSEEAAA